MAAETRRRVPLAWIVRTAWRDGRKNGGRFFLYALATAVGIAALVAAGSFRDNLDIAIERQAKPLLGADLVVRSRRPFTTDDLAFLASLPYDSAREIRFTNMASFPTASTSRLLQVRGIERAFPFYGDITTDPPDAREAIFSSQAALVEESVLAESGLSIGDPVVVGTATFKIAGALRAVPGEAVASVFDAPRVYVSFDRLDETGLLGANSLIRDRIAYRIPNAVDLEAAVSRLRAEEGDENRWRIDTVAERKERLGRRADNAARFLNLAALITLLLGGIGVATVFHAYIKEKDETAATLRCLGASASDVLAVFMLQAAALGCGASLIGAAAGIALQSALPGILSNLVYLEVPTGVSWSAAASGLGMGFFIAFLFTALPLAGLRSIPPLAALRANFEATRSPLKDPFAVAAAGLLAVALFTFASAQVEGWLAAAAVPMGVAASIGILAAGSRLFLKWLRAHVSSRLSPVWRHGLANLFRPHNHTTLLISALGLGAGLLFVIAFLQTSLVRHLREPLSADGANMALIDVQSPQIETLSAALREAGHDLAQTVPMVGMRIHGVKGTAVAAMREEPGRERIGWAFRREYRSTYRNYVDEGERIVAGAWPAPPDPARDAIPVSLEVEIAERLGVKLGDRIDFDVQGVVIETRVAALREVDWLQLRPNFFAVFPDGILESAPQFHVVLMRAATSKEAAAIQRRVRRAFPNVSTVDLRLILETIDRYFEKIAVILRAMALFVLATGLFVFAGALLASRFERLRETALLRTLGAPRRYIAAVHLIEYALMGLLAGLGGLALGSTAGALISRFAFEIPFRPAISAILGGPLALSGLTALAGVLLGRGLLNRPPLEVLRQEE